MSNKKTSWSNFKLRAQLLRIWFMKNILVWLQIFLIVSIVLILTGNITENTPFFGLFIYPFFKPLIDEISAVVVSRDIANIMDFFAISISILTSIGVALIKVRNIAQTDIKNDNLKLALIKANLYFNSDGKLVKKTEAMVGRDLDGDGKIDGQTIEPTKGLFSGIVTAAEELKIIATADFSGTAAEDEAQYQEALKKADLKDNEQAINEIDKTVKRGLRRAARDATVNEIDKQISENINNKERDVEEKIARDSALLKLKKFILNIFKKKEEEDEREDAEVIVNNMDNDASIKEIKAKPENKIEKVLEKQNMPVKNPIITTKDNDISSYLAQFKK